MANARGKAIDNTHLSIDNAEDRGFIHRDYIAHCFRWSHVVKYLLQKHRYKTATILDIGCGKEVPLAKLLYSNKMTGCTYIGVDVNKLDPEFNFGKMEDDIHLFGQTDAALNIEEAWNPASGMTDIRIQGKPDFNWFKKPSVITCFEVLEHVEPEHTVRILKKIREVLSEDGLAFISTPCFNGSAAGNHVNEITYEALGTLIESLGFGIYGVYGTFASQRDIESVIQNGIGGTLWKAYERLKDYYDSNVLATFLAPMFPQYSRNALWVLKKNKIDLRPGAVNLVANVTFPEWDELSVPWTSSDKWKELRV